MYLNVLNNKTPTRTIVSYLIVTEPLIKTTGIQNDLRAEGRYLSFVLWLSILGLFGGRLLNPYFFLL